MTRRPAPGSGRRRGRAPALLAGTLAASALLAGCGIRSTSVPVDAGQAPSRVACVVPGDDRTSSLSSGTIVRVYLVCGSRVAPVQRTVSLPDEQLGIARALLTVLATEPGPDEAAAGFESPVPDELKVRGRAPGDPKGALRLSRPLDELPSFVLAQIVCTYAETGAAAGDESVILGGPADGSGKPLQRFHCGTALRSSPEAAATAGVPV